MSIAASAITSTKRYSQCMVGIEFWLRPWRFKIEHFRNDDEHDVARIDLGPLRLKVMWLFDEDRVSDEFIVS